MNIGTIEFRGTVCNVQKMNYQGNDRIALVLVEADTGIPYMKASVNVAESTCPDGCTFIKDYGENQGIEKALRDAGIISTPRFKVRAGHAVIGCCEVLV